MIEWDPTGEDYSFLPLDKEKASTVLWMWSSDNKDITSLFSRDWISDWWVPGFPVLAEFMEKAWIHPQLIDLWKPFCYVQWQRSKIPASPACQLSLVNPVCTSVTCLLSSLPIRPNGLLFIHGLFNCVPLMFKSNWAFWMAGQCFYLFLFWLSLLNAQKPYDPLG